MKDNKKKYEEPITEELVEETAEEFKEETLKTGVVTVDNKLNIRAAASASAEVLAQLDNGSEVIITDEEGDFYAVITSTGLEGFAMKKFIK